MQRQSCNQSHRTFSKDISGILRRRIERKIENVLAEDQFGFRTGKGTWNSSIVVSIPERTLETDEELCVCVCVCVCVRARACFIDWQKAFDHVNWTQLMQILKVTGIDWHERSLISKL